MVQIIGEVLHYYVEVFIFALCCEETVLHLEIVRMVEHFQDGVLPVFVFFVLKYFLYCYLLACLSVGAEVDHSESTLAGYSFDFVLCSLDLTFMIIDFFVTAGGFLLCDDRFRFSFNMFIVVDNFMFEGFVRNGDISFGCLVGFVNIFGIDIYESGFGDDSLCFFGLFIG